MTREDNPKPELRITLLVVLFLFAVNLFFYSGRFHSIDEMALLSTTESMVKWQRADINALAWAQWLLLGPDSQGLFNASGDLYAKKAPLVAWLAAPLYALAGLVGFGQVQAAMLLNALVVAATGGVVFRFARRLRYGSGTAVWAGLLFGLGTSALVYARYLFTEPVAGLGFLLAAEAVWRERNGESDWRVMALGGAGLGVAVLTNPVNIVFTPIFFVARLPFAPSSKRATPDALSVELTKPSLLRQAAIRRESGGALIALLWPLALSLVIMAIWNVARFGSPLVSGYHLGAGEGFTSPLRISLPGMLFSPARGFVWFVPASFLALAGLIAFFRRHTRLAAMSLALIAGHVLVFSAWWMWWSGWGWGPRFLVPITPFIALLALPILESAARIGWLVRATVTLVFVISVGVQVLGASVGFDEYENLMTQTHLRGDPEGDLYKYGLDVLWGWKLSPIIGHADLLRAGNTDLAWLPHGQVDWLMLAPLGLMVAVTGVALFYSSHRRGAGVKPLGGHPAKASTPIIRVANSFCVTFLCITVVLLVLWRAGAHPLRATYGLDPLEGRAALESVMARAQPNDGALLIRPLTPGEMDHFSRFPRAYGIPDDSMFGAEWNTDLERLVDNAQARHRRLWLVVQSEDDSFAAQIAERLKLHWRRADRAIIDRYAVVLFEPR